MSNLPEAVRAAVQQADAEWSSLYGNGDDGPKVVNAPDPIDLIAGMEDGKPEGTQQVATAQEEPAPKDPAPEPAPAPEAQPQQAPQPDPWEQRYKVLKGKYDAEVPELRQQLRQAMTSIEALTTQVQQLSSKPPEPEKPTEVELTADERTAFGDDLIQVTRKIAQAEAARAAREVRDQLSKTEATMESVSKTADEVAYERFLSKVSQAVPDWQAVNQRQDWLEWLGQYDPLLGSQRQAVLDAATKSRDASRVAAVFDAFKATLPATTEQATPPAQTVETHVAPRSTTATPTQPSQAKRVYSEADIASLFRANRQGEFTREQWATISAEIDAAVAEGRVR